uniref:Ubiquitin-like protease family profile domain-containing protein n=1 Tax=Lactuca sativa TaxID=4236 RepID=A0A9R1UZI2_LACSA|nr:hypothetical protein LSAT_V11C700369890 [Lactuca sativa]
MLDNSFFTDVEEEPDSLKTLLEEWIKWSGNPLLTPIDDIKPGYLYEEIKNGGKTDHGICFVSPSAISKDGRTNNFKKSDEASEVIACRLSTRKDNNIILMPYNPSGHWVLAVLDMQTTTCNYLNSLRCLVVDPDLKQLIEAALSLHARQSGSKKKVKANWINVMHGYTKCGYYVLKFMKEVVGEGLEVLNNNFLSQFWGKNEYTDVELDRVREEWAIYVINFLY